MKILDATCGAKNMWFQPNHPLVTFMDIREGTFVNWIKRTADRRIIKVNPDVIADWSKTLPFENGYFDIILFDPPHIIKNREHSGINETHMEVYYGYLFKDNWREYLSKGINELFRVLKDEGVFIFKWGERTIKTEDVLKLFPYKPIFGNRTNGCSANDKNTTWLVFLKYRMEKPLC